MQPQNHNYTQPTNFGSTLRKLVIALALLGVVLLGLLVYRASTFHIIRTDPSTARVATVSPAMQVYFSKPLADTGLVITSTGGLVESHSINNKVLRLQFKVGRLDTKQTYRITIQHIQSKDGKVLSNQVISFAPKNIPYDKLSKDEQSQVISRQDHPPYSEKTIYFANTQDLLDFGVSSDQLEVIKQSVYNFSVLQKKEYANVTIQQDSIKPGYFDPNGPEVDRTMTFAFNADSEIYNAKLVYSGLSNATVYLYNQAGALVYDPTNPGE